MLERSNFETARERAPYPSLEARVNGEAFVRDSRVANVVLTVSEPKRGRGRRASFDLDRLDEWVDGVCAREPGLRRRASRIAELQRRLRSEASGAAWALYLDVEQAEVERWLRVAVIVARGAYAAGSRKRVTRKG
jgi:hypothetical protein